MWVCITHTDCLGLWPILQMVDCWLRECICSCLLHLESLVKCKMYPKSTPEPCHSPSWPLKSKGRASSPAPRSSRGSRSRKPARTAPSGRSSWLPGRPEVPRSSAWSRCTRAPLCPSWSQRWRVSYWTSIWLRPLEKNKICPAVITPFKPNKGK